jgi:hypothetical protein
MLCLSLLISACSPVLQPTTVGTPRIAPEISPLASPDITIPSIATVTTVAEGLPAINVTATLVAEQTADCPSKDALELGAAIAQGYDFTSTEQVMTWFCDGAELEDILVALETEEQTGTSAEEMLIMLAAGLTWEEIWIEVGLTE